MTSSLLDGHAGFVGWDHVLDVYEGFCSSVSLEDFQGFLDHVSDVEALLLTVLDPITRID